MYDLIFRVSSLALVYGALAIIVVTIRAAVKAKRQDSGVTGHVASHRESEAKPGADPYYQVVCHHSRPLHLTK
jgi:hypothetical protein